MSDTAKGANHAPPHPQMSQAVALLYDWRLWLHQQKTAAPEDKGDLDDLLREFRLCRGKLAERADNLRGELSLKPQKLSGQAGPASLRAILEQAIAEETAILQQLQGEMEAFNNRLLHVCEEAIKLAGAPKETFARLHGNSAADDWFQEQVWTLLHPLFDQAIK